VGQPTPARSDELVRAADGILAGAGT
jgi:hypothetical protein